MVQQYQKLPGYSRHLLKLYGVLFIENAQNNQCGRKGYTLVIGETAVCLIGSKQLMLRSGSTPSPIISAKATYFLK